MQHTIILALTASVLSGCSAPAPKVLHAITIGQETTGGEALLALPFTITAPEGGGAFLFTDKLIEEIETKDTLLLMDGTGAAWNPRDGKVPSYAHKGLERGFHYVSVDWEELGFDKTQQRRIVNVGKRHGVKSPDIIYTFGTYWVSFGNPRERRISEVFDWEQVRHLYTFELIERGEFVMVVRKRRQPVRIVSSREADGVRP